MNSSRIEILYEKAKPYYNNGDPGHDLAHIDRVMANCRWLSGFEGGQLEIILAAAMLHDVINLPKNHPERLHASQMAATKSRELLVEAGFKEIEIAQIQQVIVEHSYSLGKAPTSLESKILQDADKLDALGAIGIMRTVSCGVKLGCSYYSAQEPFATNRTLDDKSFTLDHFETKLFKLPDLMNTPAAKTEAHRRAQFMRSFLTQLQKEISEPKG